MEFTSFHPIGDSGVQLIGLKIIRVYTSYFTFQEQRLSPEALARRYLNTNNGVNVHPNRLVSVALVVRLLCKGVTLHPAQWCSDFPLRRAFTQSAYKNNSKTFVPCQPSKLDFTLSVCGSIIQISKLASTQMFRA